MLPSERCKASQESSKGAWLAAHRPYSGCWVCWCAPQPCRRWRLGCCPHAEDRFVCQRRPQEPGSQKLLCEAGRPGQGNAPAHPLSCAKSPYPQCLRAWYLSKQGPACQSHRRSVPWTSSAAPSPHTPVTGHIHWWGFHGF